MRGRHSRVVMLAVVVALLLGLGGWWSLGRTAARPEEGDPATARPGPASVAVPSPLQIQSAPPVKAADGSRTWTPGVLYRYALTTRQQVLFRETRANTPPPPGMQFDIQGEWLMGVASAREGRIDARVQLQPSSFSMNVGGQGTLPPEVQARLTAALATPFFITLDGTGAVKFVHFPQQSDVLVQGLLRSFVAATQFVVAGTPAASWDMQEYDSTGEYSAAYVRRSATRFEKTKRAYSRLATPQGLLPPDKGVRVSVRSNSGFELAEDLWPQSLQVQENLEVNAGEGMPVLTNDLQLSLRLLERRTDPSLLGAFGAQQTSLMTLPLASYLGQQEDPLNHHRQILQGRRFEDMVRDLRSLPTDEKERDTARTLALERLRALFLIEPSEAAKVHDVLRSGIDPLAASPMLGALSAASTSESIHSLAGVTADSTLSPEVRTDAVAALGVAAEPTREGVDALRRSTRDAEPMMRDTATLALGNAAMQLRDGDAQGADAVMSELRNAFHSATTPQQQALVLRALGNTRAPGALPVLQEGLRSTQAIVREAAVVALRNLPGQAVDQLLSEHLLGDAAPEVRKSVVFACSFRPLVSFLPALQQSLQTDPAAAVRSDIVTLLGGNRASLPLVDPLLVWASRNDRSPDIRKAALDYLNPSARPLPTAP